MLCQNALFCVKIDFAAFKAALFPNTVSDNYLHPHFVQILFCATHFQFVMSRCNSILFRATLFCCSFDLPHKIVLLRKPNQNFFCCCLCTHSTRLVDVFTLILFRFIQTFCLVQFYWILMLACHARYFFAVGLWGRWCGQGGHANEKHRKVQSWKTAHGLGTCCRCQGAITSPASQQRRAIHPRIVSFLACSTCIRMCACPNH